MNNINLIGYRCSGKSSVGPQLAAALQLPFVDADAVFMEQTTISIAEFVAKDGWHRFRQVESRILSDICQKDNIVLATGGGVVLDLNNRRLLRENGINFWLRIDQETILSRLRADSLSATQRPPLSSLNQADEISAGLRKREPFYRELADHTIAVDKLSVAEVVAELLSEYRNRRK
ncbi:MAG: shikimate kinase [Deltaproteobacteria bacterium]|nr:shikimate kinase [Deltaproteobacteria bacterium]